MTAHAARTRVGDATATFAVAATLGTVQVKLTAHGQRLVHRLHGVKLTYRATARLARKPRLRCER